MARRAFADVCRTKEDWIELREIFTRSFKKYPLFEHVVPNPQKRTEFVRKFIDANYAVHTADRSALPLIIRKMTGIQDGKQSTALTHENRLQQIAKTKMETFGGVLFITPAKDGIGWSTNPNEVYTRSYKKHGLHEIDAEAFERLKTYEDWETEHVMADIYDMKLPMWNGMLCAIDPKYAGNGIGCEAFTECMKYLDNCKSIFKESKDTNSSKYKSKEQGSYSRLSMQSRHDTSDNNNPYDCFATKVFHNLSLITHHPHHAFSFNTSNSAIPSRKHKVKSPKRTPTKSADSQPLVALSHCPRAVQFHTRNGFQCIKKVPYYPPGEESAACDVYVLMTDVKKYLR